MARALRIEYPGAVYHVMARGNQGQAIFQDDPDRRCFLATLGEACAKTGWRIHAYVLMANYYHLLVETPEGNLVAGMKWLQGAYTQRYNHRHKLHGHLFQGRYKALIVDEHSEQYFEVVSTYIHLNPARAGCIRIGQDKLARYGWSSYRWYRPGAGQRPPWLCCERVLGSLGLSPQAGQGYEAYLESRVLELGNAQGSAALGAQWKALRRGWYLGEESFLERLQGRLAGKVAGRRRESHSGAARRTHDEAEAEHSLKVGLRVLGLREPELARLPKGAAEKVALAWWLRSRTTVSLRWVSERLDMGHYTRVSQAVNRMQRKPSRKLAALKAKLRQTEEEV